MARMTSLQRLFDAGAFVLPDTRPAGLDERAWAVLVRHVRDRVPYAALAAEWQLAEETTRRLAERAAAALRYPDLADLPASGRRALALGGYTTREAIARASDEELLRLKGLGAERLQAVRAVIPASATRPRILVFRGDRLAAVFVSGAPPIYHGAAGARVRTLVEADRLRYNPWALEVRASGLYHDTAHWFLASVLLGSGLAQAGFRVASFGEPSGRAWWEFT